MAEAKNQSNDGGTAGLSQMKEAVEHNLTASRLLVGGAIAIGAAATAYFWDPTRRDQFMESTRRFSDGMMSWWGGQPSGGSGRPD